MERASALINDSSQVWLICTVNKRHTSRHTACAVFLSLSRFGLCIRFTLVPFKFEPLTKAIRSIALQWLISKKWTQHIKMCFGFVCVFFFACCSFVSLHTWLGIVVVIVIFGVTRAYGMFFFSFRVRIACMFEVHTHTHTRHISRTCSIWYNFQFFFRWPIVVFFASQFFFSCVFFSASAFLYRPLQLTTSFENSFISAVYGMIRSRAPCVGERRGQGTARRIRGEGVA